MNTSITKCCTFILGALISVSSYAGKPTNEYTAVEVKLPRTLQLTQVNAINELGEITGIANKSGGGSSAFIYHENATIELGTLGGGTSNGVDINVHSQAVGSSAEAGNLKTHAFLYDNGVMINLDDPVSWQSSRAKSINDYSIIVGNASSSSNYAFIYDLNRGVLENLNSKVFTNNEWSLETAVSINNVGQIIGIAKNEINGGTITRNYLFENGDVTFLPLTAFHINNQGLITGRRGSNAAYYDSVSVTDIGPGIGYESNNQGTIVGLGFGGSGQISNYAFIYDITNGMRDLNDLVKGNLCCKLLTAIGINDAGQILVTGREIKGKTVQIKEHAFILTPIN